MKLYQINRLSRFTKEIFVGCVCAPLLVVTLFIILLVCYVVSPTDSEGYIPQMNVNLKLTQLIGEGRARLYISDSNNYTDYVEFKFTQITAPELYFHPNNGLFVIDSDSFYQIEIVKEKQPIRYLNKKKFFGKGPRTPKYSREEEMKLLKKDSIQDASIKQILGHPIYEIRLWDNATGFRIFDDNGELIYDTLNN